MSGYLRAISAELIGTFALVWTAAAAVCVDSTSGGRLGLAGIALAYGLAAGLMTWTFEPMSGAHFNPAVTVAAVISEGFDAIKAVFYLFAQLIAAGLAGLLLGHVFGPLPRGTAPALGGCSLSGVGFRAGTLLEALAAVALMLGRSACRGNRGALAGAQGAALAAAVLAIGPLTGAAVNPARAFGPSLVGGQWPDWYVYWIGPVVGAVAGGLIYAGLDSQSRAAKGEAR